MKKYRPTDPRTDAQLIAKMQENLGVNGLARASDFKVEILEAAPRGHPDRKNSRFQFRAVTWHDSEHGRQFMSEIFI